MPLSPTNKAALFVAIVAGVIAGSVWLRDTLGPKATYRPTPPSEPARAGCCKVCGDGKPCGDSCIPTTRTCHEGPGCAC